MSCGALLPGCLSQPTAAPLPRDPRLLSRPGVPSAIGQKGRTEFAVEESSAVIYVPSAVQAAVPTGLLLFLHGALRTVDFFVDGHRPAADRAGVIILAPYASRGTWDAIRSTFATDVSVLDAALQWTFSRWRIDPARVVLSGFSDGGTYALGMGRANGVLFSKVVAYSPGFLIGVQPTGKPPILITHGTADTVLPIDATSRRIVPSLRALGYEVDYREFDGPHAVPLAVATEVVEKLGTAS